MFCGYRLPAPDAPVHSPGWSPCPARFPFPVSSPASPFSTQADQYGIYRYPNFQCRIRRTDRGLFLEKTSGSQRVSGYLFREGTQRYVFLGGATVNDEPQVTFSGLAHGAPAESDVVALLRPHAGGFLLLFPERHGGYEVLEFSR